MKVVITGGHHNSGLLLAKAFQERGEKVFWFGHKFTMLGNNNPSAEYLEVTRQNIPFYEIKAGKLQKRYKFIQNFLRIPQGFGQSFFYLLNIKPDVIVSFGGYIALPVAVSGWILGIPIFTHEQTVVSGLANKIISKFSKKIFISFKTSEKYFPKEKIVFSGLPIRKAILENSHPLFKNSKKKTIYITGGKQGSHVINEAVFDILPKLLEKFNVIHQCGSASPYNDIEKGLRIKKENYLVKDYFFADEIGDVYHSADFVIGRSGAHTIYELLILQKPAILIPIPWSSNNEQMENAKMLALSGLAEILQQDQLKETLYEKIIEFSNSLHRFKLKDASFIPKLDAIEIIMEEIYKSINSKF